MPTKPHVQFMLLLALPAFALTGCETMTDATRTKAQAASIGAAACAALAIALTDCDDCDKAKKRRENALISGVVCGLAGYAYGSHVAKKKAEYASNEEYLDAVLAEAIRVQQDTRSKNTTLQAQISDLERRVAEAEAMQADSDETRKALNALRKELKGQLSAARTQLRIVEREIGMQQAVLDAEKEEAPPEYEVRAASAVSGLDTERERLESYIAQLELIDERVIR